MVRLNSHIEASDVCLRIGRVGDCKSCAREIG